MGYFDAKQCNRCKRKVDTFDYNFLGGLCSNCKFKRSFYWGLLFFAIALMIILPMEVIQYNYDLGKCINLKPTESSYNFTNTIEMNAQYNENCYFLHNHPLALPSYFITGTLLSICVGIFSGIVIFFTKPRGFKRLDDD